LPDPVDLPIERRRDEPNPAAVGFVLQLGRALHSHGHSAGRLEDILGVTADRLGLPGHQFFSTPTSIMASFGPAARQRTYLLRVEPGDVNLGKLAELETVALDVAHGRCSPEQGSATIERIVIAPPSYGPAAMTIAHGVASGAACVFFGGGLRDVVVAMTLGLGLGVFSLFSRAHARVDRVFEPLASFLVSAAAIGLAHLIGPLSPLVATLSGLIILMPGFTLTTALSELATRHLASGTARLSGAFITFLSIAFGVAVGTRVGATVFGAPPVLTPPALPTWVALLALLAAPVSFALLLRAELRDTPWIVLTGALGIVGGRLGAAAFGPELGAFAGALAVALASSAYERVLRRPAAVVLVPGILQLVPGSVGFRSLVSLMDRDALAGIQTAFSMLLTAIALVAGLLIAGIIVPESRIGRRALH
jgi:uncharacterized membrane protein YjjP (DUF1212 family)